MKQRRWIEVAALVLAASSLACSFIAGWPGVRGSGKVAEEERSVSDFTGVALSGIGNLYIEVGDEEALRIEAEDNLLPYLETEVRGTTLEITTRENVNLLPLRPVNFYLTVKALDTITVSGSGHAEAPGLQAEQFFATVSGSGSVKMAGLEAEALNATISGSGGLDIAGGEVEMQDITLSGSGKYEAKGMESAEADVRLSGSGSATVRVRDRLDVTISGSGSVRYVGDPIVRETVSGSGGVSQIGD
jgi:hypothetical protein